MIHLALLLLTAASLACLCAGIARHQSALFGRALPAGQSRLLKRAGWAMLVIATVLACAVLGSGYGLVEALGFASLGGFAAMALLARANRQRGRR